MWLGNGEAGHVYELAAAAEGRPQSASPPGPGGQVASARGTEAWMAQASFPDAGGYVPPPPIWWREATFWAPLTQGCSKNQKTAWMSQGSEETRKLPSLGRGAGL